MEHCFDEPEASHYYNTLLDEIHWQQDKIKVFGKTYLQPRLTALFGNTEKTYSYSNLTMHPRPFTRTLLEIMARVEAICGISFNCCLANLYRNGQDSNGWHADNEKELGNQPVIASVSFGAERFFHFKHRHKKDLRSKINLTHGSLLIMKGATQDEWLHQIPKTKKNIGKRINLTFRVIV